MDIYKYGFKQISKQNLKEFLKNLQGGPRAHSRPLGLIGLNGENWSIEQVKAYVQA